MDVLWTLVELLTPQTVTRAFPEEVGFILLSMFLALYQMELVFLYCMQMEPV